MIIHGPFFGPFLYGSSQAWVPPFLRPLEWEPRRQNRNCLPLPEVGSAYPLTFMGHSWCMADPCLLSPSIAPWSCVLCASQTLSYVLKHPLPVPARAPIQRLGPGLPAPWGYGFPQGRHLVEILSRPIASPSPGLGTEKAFMFSMAKHGVDLRRTSSGKFPIRHNIRPPLWVRMSLGTRLIQDQPAHAQTSRGYGATQGGMRGQEMLLPEKGTIEGNQCWLGIGCYRNTS